MAQNGVMRLVGGDKRLCLARSDRESSEVTSNPDPTGGLGVLRPRSDRSRSSAPKSGYWPKDSLKFNSMF